MGRTQATLDTCSNTLFQTIPIVDTLILTQHNKTSYLKPMWKIPPPCAFMLLFTVKGGRSRANKINLKRHKYTINKSKALDIHWFNLTIQ